MFYTLYFFPETEKELYPDRFKEEIPVYVLESIGEIVYRDRSLISEEESKFYKDSGFKVYPLVIENFLGYGI